MLIDFAVFEDFYDPTFIEDYAAVGNFLNFGNLQGVDDDGFPLLSKAEDEFVDFFLCSHIHALGRVVEEKHISADVQPAARASTISI